VALMLAVAIAVGVLVATRLQPGAEPPREAIVRMIDDSAAAAAEALQRPARVDLHERGLGDRAVSHRDE